MLWGSGCGSVGRAATSNSRDLRFESNHRQKIILNIYCQLYWKDENKERPGMAHFYLKKFAVRCRQLEIRSVPDTTYVPSYRCYAFVAIVNKCFPQLWTDNEFLSLLFEGHVCGLLSLTMWFKCVRARVQTSLTGMTAYFTYLQRDKVHNQTTVIWAMVLMVVSVLILYSDDPSSNPAEVYSLNFVKLFEKYKN